MSGPSPNDVYDRKKREKALRDAENAGTPAERRARFPSEVKTKLSALQDALAKCLVPPLSIAFKAGTPHDTDGGGGLAALDFTLLCEDKRYANGCINVVDNGMVEFYDRTAAMHEPAIHLTFVELTEEAVVAFLARMTERHLRV